MQGRGSSHRPPSSSDQVSPTLGFYHFSRLSDLLGFHSSLSTSPTPEPLFPLESLSPWPLALSPSSPSPSHARACPPPPTPASALLPAGSTLSPTQGDSMALVLAPSHTGHLHTPLKDQLSQALSIQAVLHQPWHGDRRQPKPGASPP